MVRTVRNAISYLQSDRSLWLALAVITVELVPLEILRLLKIHFAYGMNDANRHPAAAIGALLVFGLTLWAALHVLDELFRHWWHDRVPEFWMKIFWLIVLLVWPYGPVAYFLFVYRRDRPSVTNATAA